MPLKLKGRLDSGFSVRLYNCEVWNNTETEMKALMGNGVPDEKVVEEVVRSADDKRLMENQLLEMLGVESIQSLFRKRKLQLTRS